LPNASGTVTRVVSGSSVSYTVQIEWSTSDKADQQIAVTARVQ